MEGIECPDCGFHFYIGDGDDEMGTCPKCGGSMSGNSLFDDEYAESRYYDEDFEDEYDDDEEDESELDELDEEDEVIKVLADDLEFDEDLDLKDEDLDLEDEEDEFAENDELDEEDEEII